MRDVAMETRRHRIFVYIRKCFVRRLLVGYYALTATTNSSRQAFVRASILDKSKPMGLWDRTAVQPP